MLLLLWLATEVACCAVSRPQFHLNRVWFRHDLQVYPDVLLEGTPARPHCDARDHRGLPAARCGRQHSHRPPGTILRASRGDHHLHERRVRLARAYHRSHGAISRHCRASDSWRARKLDGSFARLNSERARIRAPSRQVEYGAAVWQGHVVRVCIREWRAHRYHWIPPNIRFHSGLSYGCHARSCAAPHGPPRTDAEIDASHRVERLKVWQKQSQYL
mmetsp:Transcript_22034/g.36392  ORF Transcript_22034/g.36392 Transcript_22034/m.36392 type:complete len:217 (+) Transcript_22034:877-1527(+)